MLRIDHLREPHIESALRLSTAAGWNQIAQDWRRLLVLWPDTCLGGWIGDHLAATGTLAIYESPAGRVGWIGMILVDAEHQRRGYGGEMFDRILAVGQSLGVKTFGLDATDQGRRVYLRRGFSDGMAITRWMRTASSQRAEVAPHVHAGLRVTQHQVWDSLLELDRLATRLDRKLLLRQLAGEDGALTLNQGDDMNALGFARCGRTAWHIGPLIAVATQAADAVLMQLCAALEHSVPGSGVFVDALAGAEFEAILSGHGFAPQRQLTRMFLGSLPAAPWPPACIAAAGFELG